MTSIDTLMWTLGLAFGLPLFILGLDRAATELYVVCARLRRIEEVSDQVADLELAAGRAALLAAVRDPEAFAPHAGGERHAR